MGHVNRWNLTDELRNGVCKEIKEFIDATKDIPDTGEAVLDLYGKGISPSQFQEFMKELGYDESDCDSNGWQWDFWHTYKNGGPKKIELSGCGMTFTIMMTIKGI